MAPNNGIKLCLRATRLLAITLLGTVALATSGRLALASDQTAHIIVDGREALFMVSPYLGSGNNVYAPVDVVHLLGADFKKADAHNVTVTTADGRSFTQSYASENDRYIVPVQPLAKQLGADIDWDRSSRTLTLRAKILMVKVDGGKLSIATSYPVAYRTGLLSDPNRAYVDLFGAALGTDSSSIPMHAGDVNAVRSKQMEFNTVRIALDMGTLPKLNVGAGTKSDRIQLALTGDVLAQPVAIAAAKPVPAPSAPVQVAAKPPVAPLPAAPIAVKVPLAVVAPIAVPAPVQTASVPTEIVASKTTKPVASSFRITNVEYVSTVDNKPAVVITTTGKAPMAEPRVEQLDAPARIAVDLQGAELAMPADNPSAQLVVSNPIIKCVRWGTTKLKRTAFGRVVLDLTRPADFKVSTEILGDGTGQRYTLTLNDPVAVAATPAVAAAVVPPTAPLGSAEPPVADPSVGTPAPIAPVAPVGGLDPTVQPTQPVIRPTDITNLTIIVDAGHGGKDSGAPGASGLYEKNITLQIAKRVRDIFTDAGAKVIMTRADDTFIPLPDRSQLGVDNHADLFVSIHCDSGNSRNANSGSTVYYHGNNSVCKELASDVAGRMKEANCGIAQNGTRTDYVRFPGVGFSVLRRSPEPAVLVECGYINSDADAQALQQSDTQDLIAKSILAGVKDYVANRVARN